MKSLLSLLLFFITLFPVRGQSLLEPGKRWMNLVMAASGGPPPYWIYTTTVEFAEDTLVNAHLYKKVLVSYDEQASSWVKTGYVRETADKKVLGFPNLSDTAERLVYDFNLQAGQQAEVHPPGLWFGGIQVGVISVDSVLFSGEMHKRINLANESWIEGIGSDRGVIYGGTGPYVGVVYTLNCYFYDGTLLYHNPGWPVCYNNNLDTEEIYQPSPARIYPNPAEETCLVETKLLPATISIFDNTGREVLHQKMADSPCRIRLGPVSDGIYHYCIRQVTGGLYHGQLVISRKN